MTSRMSPFTVITEDWHTAGEPFRIVPDLPPHCTTQGDTVAERRINIVNDPDHPVDLLRRSLCHEPRGHADMYGGFIVPPNDSGAHLGVLYFHKDGFSTACGHGTIALGCWAVSTGRVKAEPNGYTDVVIDVPSGRVIASVFCRDDTVSHVDFVNVPSYQLAKAIPLHLDSLNLDITTDLAWGGAVYAFINASDIQLPVIPENHDTFVRLGREVKKILAERARFNDLNLYGVCFFEEMREDEGKIEQRNVVVFADRQIDRSPCGSGTAARVAILHAQGIMTGDKRLVHHSIIHTTFEAVVGKAVESTTEFPACEPRVRGMAHRTGCHTFYIDPDDPIYPGFTIR